MTNQKTDPTEDDTDEGEGKVMTIKLRPIDLQRMTTAKERTGIGKGTDVLRHALAKLCEQWEPAAKGGAR